MVNHERIQSLINNATLNVEIPQSLYIETLHIEPLRSNFWRNIAIVSGVVALVALVAAAALFTLPAAGIVAASTILFYSGVASSVAAGLSTGVCAFATYKHFQPLKA